MVADLHHFDKQRDRNPHESEKSDPDPHESEKLDADPHKRDANLQPCLHVWPSIILFPTHFLWEVNAEWTLLLLTLNTFFQL